MLSEDNSLRRKSQGESGEFLDKFLRRLVEDKKSRRIRDFKGVIGVGFVVCDLDCWAGCGIIQL